MKRLTAIWLLTIMGLALSGCIYVDVKGPGLVQTDTQFTLSSGDFKVIERVTVTGETTLWFGAVLTGGEGYQALLAEAQRVGGDSVMDYSFDMEVKSIFMFIYSKASWKATGVAVKYTDKIR